MPNDDSETCARSEGPPRSLHSSRCLCVRRPQNDGGKRHRIIGGAGRRQTCRRHHRTALRARDCFKRQDVTRNTGPSLSNSWNISYMATADRLARLPAFDRIRRHLRSFWSDITQIMAPRPWLTSADARLAQNEFRFANVEMCFQIGRVPSAALSPCPQMALNGPTRWTALTSATDPLRTCRSYVEALVATFSSAWLFELSSRPTR
jgi:hypothetical protein